MSEENKPIVPDIVRDTPVVEPPAPEEKVEFSEAQQRKVQSIIDSVVARTAKDTKAALEREKAERAKIEAELKTALLAAAPDASEADKLRLQLDQERKAKEELAQSFQRERTQNAILSAATAAGMVNPSLAHRLIDVPAANADGTPNTEAIAAAIKKLLSENANLQRGEVRPGSGSGPANFLPPTPAVTVEKIFGRGSDAALANRFALSHPADYKRMQGEARRRGLI